MYLSSAPSLLKTFVSRWTCAFVAVFLLGGLLMVGSASAQGFGVYEQGTCVMARGGATVASGCGDGSSMFFNPANIAEMSGVTATIGATVIDAYGEFTYDYTSRPPYRGTEVELENDPIPVPHLYITSGLSDKMSVGLGVYVPYGLETNWPTQLDDGSYFDGAFEGFSNQVQSIYIQPTAAYQITPELRIGGGPILAVSAVELNQLQDLSQTPIPNTSLTFSQLGVPFHTAFARSSLEASNELGFGANLGLTYEVSDRLSLGARFTTPITVSFEGEASFSQVPTNLTIPTDISQGGQVLIPAGTPIDNLLAPQFSGNGQLTTQTVETELTFPMQIIGGVQFEATDRLRLMADYQFTGWSAFDEIPLEFERLGDQVRNENYQNTHGLHVGAEYDVIEPLTARAGYVYNTAAAPDEVVTPLLPESDRNQFTVGFGWRPVDIFEINASYQLLQQNDRRGRVRGPLPGESVSTDLNQGLYSFGANLFGVTFTLHF